MKAVSNIIPFILAALACAVTAFADRDPMSLDNLPMDSIQQYAKDGDCNAQYLLAERLLQGNKIAKDENAALAWMNRAARCGNKWAMDEMGIYFFTSKTNYNEDSGRYWIKMAADRQVGSSQTIYGALILDLATTGADSAEAYMWSHLGVLNAGQNSREIYDSMQIWLSPELRVKGDSMVIPYLTERLKEAENRNDSDRFITSLADMGWPEALYIRGLSTYNDAKLMYDVFKVPEDSTKQHGIDMLRKSADAGYVPAERELGTRYYTGAMVDYKSNYDSAYYWLGKATEAGDAEAEMRLGFMYQLGEGVKKNPKEALRLFKLSAAQYYPEGIRSLGYFYWSKDAPKKNPVRARALLTLAKSFYIDVDIIPIGETARKMNDKEKAESEQLMKDMDDKDRIKTIIESWVD